MIYPDFYPFYAAQGNPVLYDEYPDRFMLYHICHQVKGQMEGDTSVQEIPGGFLDDLIEVLVYQEISRRRCRRRRCRKCFRTEY